ncbi:hypothetical protein HME9304_01559 [Flagellimonas maritima]|uniref:Uncharacterized protein n=2 Tax=Flagellimonas maritima TaxID=1383885 RepID=A0A2Z4LRU3_9FLAO|nr:hypothetical protein HME9304_01559 [Allomuricauda aurantiaca]
MISSFFGKTKPINYIVLSVFMFLFYCFHVYIEAGQKIDIDKIPFQVLTLGVLLLSIYIINRIVRIEKVTDFSSYAILFFVLLFVVFSDVLLDNDAIFCNFFLLLAIWRLLAIKSIKNVKHKVFDASLLICLASLFYDWALVFLILVFLVINIYDKKTIKNWMVPIVSVLTIAILVFTVLKVDDNISFFIEHYTFTMDLLTEGFYKQGVTIKLIIYSIVIVLLMLLVFIRLQKKGGGKQVLLQIVFSTFILGVIVSFFKSSDNHPVIFTFFPTAVFLTNYLETIKKMRLREIAFIVFIVLSFSVYAVEVYGN